MFLFRGFDFDNALEFGVFFLKEYLVHVSSVGSVCFLDNDLDVLIAWPDGVNGEHLSAFFIRRVESRPVFELNSVFWHKKIDVGRIRRIRVHTRKTKTLVEFRFPLHEWDIEDHWLGQPLLTHPKRIGIWIQQIQGVTTFDKGRCLYYFRFILVSQIVIFRFWYLWTYCCCRLKLLRTLSLWRLLVQTFHFYIWL